MTKHDEIESPAVIYNEFRELFPKNCISCKKGWYGIIYQMCSTISFYIEQEKPPEDKKPYFNTNSNFNSSFNNKNILKAIEYLLWNWKSELSREWYPFLFGLKHDLLIYQNKLSLERLAKTQTLPLTQFIKGENE